MTTDILKQDTEVSWQQLETGCVVYGGGTALSFNTGEWRVDTPVMDWEKCKQCLLCEPVCPDGCIPVKEGKRLEFDYDHCKGCGICAKVCKFGAIIMKVGEK